MYSSGEETSTGVTDQQQQSVDVVEEFNKLEIDVSLQRKEATCGQYANHQGRAQGWRGHGGLATPLPQWIHDSPQLTIL